MIPTKEMKEMRAFFGKQSIKDKFVTRVEAHAKADEIIKGQYWEDGKGCAVGCTIESNESGSVHKKFETELGIPESLARLEDFLFETMPNEDAKLFPAKFLKAIPVGADLSKVPAKMIVYILNDVIGNCGTDEQAIKAINGVRELWEQVAAGKEVASAAWSAAWSAAEFAAWSAAESAARSAAESAARSAAWSAARSAAWSAAEFAAWSAADSAAGKRYGDHLIALLASAPVPDGIVEDSTVEKSVADIEKELGIPTGQLRIKKDD